MSLANTLGTGNARMDAEASRCLMKAAAWLTQSGIQEQESAHSGGFYAWYSTQERNYSYLYSEITGYAITTMIYLDRILPGATRQAATEQAAFWLLDKAWVPDEGGFLAKYFPQKDSYTRQIYTFDTGMILNGFVHLFRETDNSFCLAVASKAVDFITQRMISPSGMPYPILDVDSGTVIQEITHWSTDIQPYLSKVAIGLLNYADATRSEKVRSHAVKMLDWAAEKAEKRPEGAVSHSDKAIHLHPTCYAIEALLVGAVTLDRQRLLDAALKTWKFVADHQLANGGFPMLVGEGDNFERSDVCAQFIRAGHILERLGMLPEGYNMPMERALARLTQLSSPDPDPRSYGAIMHSGPERPERADPNCWCTMFAIQALSCNAGIADAGLLMAKDMMLV